MTAERVVSFQVLVYKDDFASERADRERAQSRAQELEGRLAALRHAAARRQVGAAPLLLPDLQAPCVCRDPDFPWAEPFGVRRRETTPPSLRPALVLEVGVARGAAEVAVLRVHCPPRKYVPGLLTGSSLHMCHLLAVRWGPWSPYCTDADSEA